MVAYFRHTLLRALAIAAVLILPALFLSGCSTPFSQQATVETFSGNWAVSADSGSSSDSGSFAMGGLLKADQGTMTGVLRVLGVLGNVPCVSAGSVLLFTGPIQPDGSFTLTSSSMSGQIVTLSGTIYSGSPLGTGVSTYTETGNCQDHGKFLASAMPAINGAYSGPTKPGSNSTAVTADFHESTSVNAAGEFPLTGSLTFQGSSCLASVAMNPASSYVSGSLITAQFEGVDSMGKPVTVAVSGEYTVTTIAFDYSVTKGSCIGNQGSVELPFS